MSYEKLGMGWSDIPITTGWIFKETTFPSCHQVDNGIKKCFTDTPDDLQCAEYSGCININEGCETISGRSGATYCCPPDRPPPPHVAPCVPEGTMPGAVAQEMTCRFRHVPFSSLLDARSRSIWTVQNKLCQLGIDPGPVDGTENSTKYRPAIRAFQSRQNIPVTGNPDAVTLQAMDLDNAQSLAAAIGGGSLIPGVGVGTTSLLPYLMVGAFGLSGMFLFYAVRKYKRQAIRKNGRPVVRLRKSRWLFGRQKTTWGFPQYDAVVDGISEYPFKVATITYDYDDRERGQFLPPKIWQATVEVISRDFKGLGLGRTYQHLHPLMANWKYIIYGKTPEEVAKKIQALVEAKKLKETIYYDY